MIARTLTALFVLATGALADKVDLKHTYTADTNTAYKFAGKLEDSGQEIEFKGTFNVKLTKPNDDGSIASELEIKDFELLMNGSPGPDMGMTPFTTTLDKHGMPAEVRVNQAELIFTLFGTSNFLPASEIEVGSEYKIEWAAKDKSGTVKGKGTLVEVKEEDGKKVNVVKTEVEMTPGEETPGKFVITSQFWQSNGQLLRAEGKIEIESGVVSFKFDPKA